MTILIRNNAATTQTVTFGSTPYALTNTALNSIPVADLTTLVITDATVSLFKSSNLVPLNSDGSPYTGAYPAGWPANANPMNDDMVVYDPDSKQLRTSRAVIGVPVTVVTDPVTGGLEISWLGKVVFPNGLHADGVTDDSAILNALISNANATQAAPVCIKLPYGAKVGLKEPVVLKSNIRLDVSGCHIVHLGSNQKTAFTNTARSSVNRQVSDAVITANSEIIQSNSASFSQSDVGRSIWCSSGSVGFINTHFTARILSVTDSSHAVMDSTPSASATAVTAKLYDRDTGISIVGDAHTLVTRTAGAATDSNDNHSIVIVRADDVTISGMRYESSEGKYFVLLNDVSNFKVGDFSFDSHSDIVHITGPAFNGEVFRLNGHAGDDMLALGCSDYASYCEAQGSIYNVNSHGMTGARRSGGLHLFCGNGDPNHRFDSCSFDSIRGSFVNQAVKIESGSGDSISIIDSILVSDISPTEIYPAGPAVLIEETVGSVTLRNLTDNGATGSSDFVRANANFKRILVDGFIRSDLSLATAILNIPNGKSGGALMFKGLSAKFNSSANSDIVAVSGQLSNLVFDGFNVSGHSGIKLVNAGTEQTALNISMANGYATGFSGAYLYWLFGVIDLNISNVKHGTCYMAVSGRSATTSITVRGSGFSWAPTIFAQCENGGSINLKTFDAVGELDRAGIAKTVGNIAFNTKASLGCGVGPVVSNGTAWKNLYTGATY